MFSLRSITLDGTDACTAVRSGKALSTLLTPGIQLRPKSSTRYSLVFSLECPAVDATTTGTGVPLGEVPSTLLTSRYPDYVLPITRTTYEKHKNQKHKCKGVGGMGGSPSIIMCFFCGWLKHFHEDSRLPWSESNMDWCIWYAHVSSSIALCARAKVFKMYCFSGNLHEKNIYPPFPHLF